MNWIKFPSRTAVFLVCIALTVSSIWPETLETGEMEEHIAAPDTTKQEALPPPPRLHRISFLNVGPMIADASTSLPLSVEYEYLGGTRNSLFISAAHAFGAGDEALSTAVVVGKRWFFGRHHAGPFLGLAPTFSIGADQGPILLAVVGSAGFLKEFEPYFFSGQMGLGPGVFWHESPRYDVQTGESETKTGAILVTLALALGIRF